MIPQGIHFDIAAVVVMAITLLSLVLRHMTRGATNRVYLTCMALVLVTALARLLGELYDLSVMPSLVQMGIVDLDQPPAARDAITMLYYALRSLTAPMYLVLIATVSSTTHRLNSSNLRRVLLWVPMVATAVLAVTNPAHHLVYHYVQGMPQSGPFMWVLYLNAAYYSLIGIAWLARWHEVLSKLEFVTLTLLYPIVFSSLIIQFALPSLHVEMFITSIAMMLLSAFVIRPEKRLDSMVNAASLEAYREMCRRALLTEKHLCLVYLEIVNLEQLREYVGKDEVQDAVREVAANLSSKLERDDVLYYLRNGLFCISPRNTGYDHALSIAHAAHEEGRAQTAGNSERTLRAKMRTCIVRVPDDASDDETLRAFIRRFAHLVPNSDVTTFSDLAKRPDFGLQMALSHIVNDAIENRSFSVHYQPIWSLADKRFHAAEALVRLHDPTFGNVSPALFIPEAEQNGSIEDIGAILLEKICAFLGGVDFERIGLDYVEVNLSAEQCMHPEMADELLGLLRANDVDPSRMNLEITETSSAYSQEVIGENIRRLAAAGLAFSLDDYGTGYSNVARMLSLPFSLVKIDKSFVDGLDDPDVSAVLADTVTMLKRIGKDVLVEGVETAEQAATLETMGVDFIQGYHFATPLPEDEFVAFLEQHNGA